ncbi:MAG: uncharacterized LabA/DUF88 family protein [Phenylobacterium sp.]|jgi:uncharacterized LabA/DUF88 family protein
MKTIVYIDGYNFYYGCLKHTSYKWLNFYQLFSQHIVSSITPEADVIEVKFFTANIQAKFATKGQQAVNSQTIYHNALLTTNPDQMTIIKGYYSSEQSKPMAYVNPPDKSNRTPIWKIEEKQTDVQMALHIYRDASMGLCEQIVVCTNDTDLAPSMALVKRDFSHIKIGAVMPIRQRAIRPANKEICSISDWSRQYILDEELKASQLPSVIPKPNGRGVYTKPKYW